jgi:hypothetical protein
MLPHQFKRLSELLRSSFESLHRELSDVKDAAKQQERTMLEGIQACEEKERKQRVTVARAIVRASSTVPGYEQTQREKEHSLQWKMFWVTLFAALAAAAAASGAFYYASIANKQLVKMNDTYKEMRWQTYYTCLNTQATQNALLQVQKSAGDSHAASAAAVTQAVAGIQAERSIITFTPNIPKREEEGGNADTFFVNWKMKNVGKSAIFKYNISAKAVLLKEGENFTIFPKSPQIIDGKNFGAGVEYPDPSIEHVATPYINVEDVDGRAVRVDSPEYSALMNGGPEMVMGGSITPISLGGINRHSAIRFLWSRTGRGTM